MELVIMYYSLNIATRSPLLKHQLLPNVHNEFPYYFTLISSGGGKELKLKLFYFFFVLIYIDNSKQGNAGSTDDNVVESVRDQEMKAATIGDA